MLDPEKIIEKAFDNLLLQRGSLSECILQEIFSVDKAAYKAAIKLKNQSPGHLLFFMVHYDKQRTIRI